MALLRLGEQPTSSKKGSTMANSPPDRAPAASAPPAPGSPAGEASCRSAAYAAEYRRLWSESSAQRKYLIALLSSASDRLGPTASQAALRAHAEIHRQAGQACRRLKRHP